jgi:hypothetical protein
MREGIGLSKDEQRGLSLQAASFNGLYNAQDPYSMTAAGIMIFQGKVVGQNIPEEQRRKDAVALYEKAAEMGYAPAQFNFAMAAKTQKDVDYHHYRRNLPLALSQAYPLALTEVGVSSDLSYLPNGLSAGRLAELLKSGRFADLLRAESGSAASASATDPADSLFPIVQQTSNPQWVTFSSDRRLVAVLSGVRVFIYETGTGRLIKNLTIDETLGEKSLPDQLHRHPEKLFFCRDDAALLVSYSAQLEQVDLASVVDLSGAVISGPFQFDGAISGYDARSDVLAVIRRKSSGLLRNGEPDWSNPDIHLLETRLSDQKVLSDLRLPPHQGGIDMEGYAAFFKNGKVAGLAHWESYEGREYGLLAFLEINDGHVRSFVSDEANQRLLKFLSNGQRVLLQGQDDEFNLGMSAALCSDNGIIVDVTPFLKWRILDNEASNTQTIARVAALDFDGISASATGEQLLAWGVKFKDKYFGPGGNYTKGDSLAWYPDTASDPVIINLSTARGRSIDVKSGNQVWNAVLGDNGQAVGLVTSLHQGVAEHNWGLPQEIGCATKLEMIEISGNDVPSVTSQGARIWPFFYATTFHADSGLGMEPTVVQFVDGRYSVDFARWEIAADAGLWRENEDTKGLFRDPNQDSGVYSQRVSDRAAISRSVEDRATGICAKWSVFPAENFNRFLGIQTSQLELTRKDLRSSPVRVGLVGKVLAAYPLSEQLVGIACDWGISIFNLEKQQQVGTWSDPSPQSFSSPQTFRSFAVSPDGKRIFYLQPDGTIAVLSYDEDGTLSELLTVVGQSSGDPIIVSKDNYFTVSSRSAQGVHFSDGEHSYPFEQFDLRLNRPDIVLERLGAPAEAVAIAKQLREKRLKRMGVTEEMLKPDFHVPELEIVGEVPSTTDADSINVAIKASDSEYPLERLKVYVNNVPVNGRDGELLREEAKSEQGLLGRITGAFSTAPIGPQNLERTIPIKLAVGRNKIQVSVLNNAGAESLYANAEVNCKAQRPKPKLYAVALGVSDYVNPDWNLKYAAKDAKDVLARLNIKAGDSYGEVKELLLTDKQVTKKSLAMIKDFLKDAAIDDTVLMFVAGHGLLDSNYDYYFGTTDIDFNNPAEKGIAFDEFDDLLAGLPSLKKSLLIDTCHAGELDEEEKTLLASAGGAAAPLPTGNGIAMRSIGTRGMNVKAIEGARGASEWYDRLQGLFVDLRRGSGSTILSSSAGAEYALESSEQQNGLFTYAVLEALDGKKDADTNKDGSVQMSELGEYVKKRVSDLTNNKQTPNTRRVNLEGDFTLAKTE